MNTAIIIIGSIAAIVGVGVATWSIISTRKKYYDEYMKRNAVQKIRSFSKEGKF